jgi:hypothetical protein
MKRNKALDDNLMANDTPPEAAERSAFPQALLDHIIAHYKQPADLPRKTAPLFLKIMEAIIF